MTHYKGYSNEEIGLGETIPQPKSTYDQVWSFGLGAAGGVATAAWYTGYTTSAIALGPVSVPMALGVGGIFLGCAVYSSVSKSKTLTTSDKMALVGGSVGVASMSLGAVGFIMPKIAFGMTAVTGPLAMPLMIGGAIVYGIADHYDTDHKLEEAKPAFYGFAGGGFVSSYLYLEMNKQEVNSFIYQHNHMPKVTHPSKVNDFQKYQAQHKSFCAAQKQQIDIIYSLQKEHGAFINSEDLVKKSHQALSKPFVFPHKAGFKPDDVPVGSSFATQESYGDYVEDLGGNRGLAGHLPTLEEVEGL